MLSRKILHCLKVFHFRRIFGLWMRKWRKQSAVEGYWQIPKQSTKDIFETVKIDKSKSKML